MIKWIPHLPWNYRKVEKALEELAREGYRVTGAVGLWWFLLRQAPGRELRYLFLYSPRPYYPMEHWREQLRSRYGAVNIPLILCRPYTFLCRMGGEGEALDRDLAAALEDRDLALLQGYGRHLRLSLLLLALCLPLLFIIIRNQDFLGIRMLGILIAVLLLYCGWNVLCVRMLGRKEPPG